MAKPKYESRATRASRAALEWRSVAEDLAALKDENDPEGVDPLILESFLKDVVTEAQGILERFSTAEVEALSEEMRGWADNYPENLKGGDKYSTIEEAAETLENLASDDVGTIDSLDDITSVIDEIERMADDLEGVEFPGMFG